MLTVTEVEHLFEYKIDHHQCIVEHENNRKLQTNLAASSLLICLYPTPLPPKDNEVTLTFRAGSSGTGSSLYY